MKKLSVLLLVVCGGIVIYLFIKEQLNGIVLSAKENLLLSVTYLLVGICLLILYLKRPRNRSN
jgi:hypothetical protein